MNTYQDEENGMPTFEEFKASVKIMAINNDINPEEVGVSDSELRKCYEDLDYREAVYLYEDAFNLDVP